MKVLPYKKIDIMLLEDDDKEMKKIKNSIKKACNNKLHVNIIECECAQCVEKYLDNKACSMFSLDQKIPYEKGGEIKEELGFDIGNLAKNSNPISYLSILTAAPRYKIAHMAGKSNIDYYGKGDISRSTYSKFFIEEVLSFIYEGSWRLSSVKLPKLFAGFCEEIGRQKPDGVVSNTMNIIYFWDAGIRLVLLSLLSLAQTMNCISSKVIKLLERRIDNEPAISAISILLNDILERSTGTHLYLYTKELEIFFANTDFISICRHIQKMRNDLMHKPLYVDPGEYEEQFPIFYNFLICMSFYVKHPIVSDIKVVRWGAKNALEYQIWNRENKSVGSDRKIWEKDNNILIDPKEYYLLINNSTDNSLALFVPLEPFIINQVEFSRNKVYFIHDIKNNRYRDPVGGNIKKLKRDIISNQLNGLNRNRVEKGRTSEIYNMSDLHKNGSYLGNDMITRIVEYYKPNLEKNVIQEDEKYQQSFSGDAKAQNVLKYLKSIRQELLGNHVYVSVGGGDASEIEYILRNSEISHGILLEYSDSGAQKARERADELIKINKNLIVIQGDAMQRLNDCHAHLQELKNRKCNAIVASFQSILHELPSRSPNFDFNILLGKIMGSYLNRTIYVREPIIPEDWPERVRVNIEQIPGAELFAISKHINDVLNIGPDPVLLSDNWLQLTSALAVETMFKILYSQDTSRYRYEMGERITSLNVDNMVGVISNYINRIENIEVNYGMSNSFRKNYKKYNVKATEIEGKPLSIPKSFITIKGYQ